MTVPIATSKPVRPEKNGEGEELNLSTGLLISGLSTRHSSHQWSGDTHTLHAHPLHGDSYFTPRGVMDLLGGLCYPATPCPGPSPGIRRYTRAGFEPATFLIMRRSTRLSYRVYPAFRFHPATGCCEVFVFWVVIKNSEKNVDPFAGTGIEPAYSWV